MLLTVLGSGTLVPDDRRRSASHLLEVEDALVLMDCGSGAMHGMTRYNVAWQKFTHIVITHFHTDHVGDLAPLLFALKHGIVPPREQPLVVLGPKGMRDLLDDLFAAHPSAVPRFPMVVVELDSLDPWRDERERFVLTTHPTPHTDHSRALRFETADGSVGYTGDTGPSRRLAGFMAGVDVLLAECTLPDPPPVDTHLTPHGVAELALRSSPALLVLTHVSALLSIEELPDLVRRGGWEGPTVVANDGIRIELNGGTVEVLDAGSP